ncbi:MAG: DNA polymerase III subunit alpha [Chloroflexia bacterium]
MHLHCRSAYSMLEGTMLPQDLVGAAKKEKMSAIAITDRNNMYGAIHFYGHAQKAGIKPILGMEVDLSEWGGAKQSSLVLLARNMDGYRNLCHLASVLRLNADPETFPPSGYEEDEEPIASWDTGVWGVPVFGFTGKGVGPDTAPHRPPRTTGTVKDPKLPREMLLSGRHARGLVALSGGERGLVNLLVMQGKMQMAARAAGMLLSAFGEGNFFIELTACSERERKSIPSLVTMASDLGIPVVASGDVLYLKSEEKTAAALARVRSGELHSDHDQLIPTAVPCPPQEGRHFRSAEEMEELFGAYPQAIANARFIADQCNVELPLHKPQFPLVEMEPDESPFSKLWKLCFEGATRFYSPLTEAVIARLKYELEVIETLEFCTYFLVVYDIVRFAHERDIPLMARGSAANSIVAYVLGITQVDPLHHNLLFERFLNTSRAEFELPDIDLDICWRRRDEVLHYVYERYGRDHVATVGTHITFRMRSAWREMAKAHGIDPQRIKRVAERLPHLLSEGELLDDNYEQGSFIRSSTNYESGDAGGMESPKLRDEVEKEAYRLAQQVEGLPRYMGMHCAGIVITPEPVANLVPLQRASRDPSMAITQYDKDALEAMGLVKIDLLGSRALTTLVDTLQASGLARGTGDVYSALEQIPFDDQATYEMMAEGDTLGCFQLESPGMRGLLKWLRPHNMDDIAAAISLFRPGPLEGGFLEAFMRRHLKQDEVVYHHPSMEPILKSTFGVILYQEQFLQLAHGLAGLGLGEAEKLRKDLGKARTPEERVRLGSWFVAGAIEKGIDQLQAEKVWEIIAGYTGFGFCKAHACSYALTAYRSAYMKAHYPAEYVASLLNNDGGFYGPHPMVYVEDARRLGIKVLPPHINHSNTLCEAPNGEKSIRFGLQFIKGLKEKTIAVLLQERQARGLFHSLPDLVCRVEMSKQELTALVKAGACDELVALAGLAERNSGNSKPEPLGLNRKQMLWLVPLLLTAKPNSKLMAGSSKLDMSVMQVLMSDFLHHKGNGYGNGHGHGGVNILGSSEGMRIDIPLLEEYTPAERLRLEQNAIGFALSRNEMDLYHELLDELGVVPSRELSHNAGREVTVGGVIVAGRKHMANTGEYMLFLTLQDAFGLIEVVIFADAYKKCTQTLTNGGLGPYLIKGQVQVNGKGKGIGVQPPSNLRPADNVSLKMHPVVIAGEVRTFDKGNGRAFPPSTIAISSAVRPYSL